MVITISALPSTYASYYRPRNYALPDVVRSLEIAADRGIRTSVNLLLFPGLTDRESEAHALVDLFRRTRLEQVQLRNLNIDPDQLMASLPADDSPALGVANFVRLLKSELPDLSIGSISRLPPRDGVPAPPKEARRSREVARVRRPPSGRRPAGAGSQGAAATGRPRSGR